MLFRRFESLIDVFKPSPDVAPPTGMLRFYSHYLKQVWPLMLAVLIIGFFAALIEVALFSFLGQRKGLGIGGRKESLFILATDTVQNVIYVGEGDSHPGLWRQALHIAPREIHWVNPARTMPAGHSARFSVRIRYRQPLQEATLFVRDQGGYILFDAPQRGITPGQFAAWYDGDELVGSGVISE